ncbi:hypothetical protein KFL_003560070 [Klebsormidium nitens]|uniref:Uncharacterized protein n=1 Tax=Klebsormidium nitens TaxID=105231 RepID=A0A1Y1I966_KLENI|nr:hypothetical protein KFL_003560070 [Klebsormidium nitens]|eukprot:GAQ87480.1 hypothetical protein KFL_003560070 [Klebsormidium nitens]
MDRFEWLRGQCWLTPWPATPHVPQTSRSAIDWVFRGTASFHVSQQEQYGGSGVHDDRGPLTPNARHLFFKTGPKCHDPTETACCVGVVQHSANDLRLVFCLADQDVWEIEASQVQRLVLQDSEAEVRQERPGKLPAVLSVIFRHVVLNLYLSSPTIAAEAPQVLSRVADLLSRALKNDSSVRLTSGGEAGAPQMARPEELACNWLRSADELAASARSTSNALAATEIVEGALTAMAAAAVTREKVRAAAGSVHRKYPVSTDAEEEVVRWMLENRGKHEGTATDVTAKLQALLQEQKKQYETRLWLQTVGAAT